MSSGIQNTGVTVINNFLNDLECQVLVDYIDNLEVGWGGSNHMRKMSLNPDNSEIKPIVIKCLDKVKEVYSDNNLFIAEYLLSKYGTGFSMGEHTDLEDGKEHFQVSVVTYLNNDFTGGDIVFPNLNFRYSPKMGDIAIFLSKPEENVHSVDKVTSGERYVMPIWITDKIDKALFA